MVKWFEEEGKLSEIVISSRIRLARNLSNYPFCDSMSEEQQNRLNQEVKTALEKINLGENHFSYLDVSALDHTEGMALAEAHAISPEFLKGNQKRLLILSKDQSVSIMVNEEDHIRIQVLKSGLDLESAFETANRIDDAMDESLNYAFDDQLGFLTACPSNLGTGLRASVMLHIPALEKAGALNKLAGMLSKLGLTIRGTFGEGSKVVGSMYQISNQITLGISEKQAIKNLHEIVLQMVEKEKEARKALVLSENFQDHICRSYGILKYARMISSEECFNLLSDLRIGISEKILSAPEISKITFQILNRLVFSVGGASVSMTVGRELSPEERDKARAEMVRKLL